ncbi:MAG: VWA domain-containing protein [Alistipes sp.]|nr:VWA domain-containing protein [Candidatus Alistipes equi]
MKTKVFNLIILDESGSMSCIERQALNGLNETLQTIRKAQERFPEQEQLVSIVPFESQNIRLLRDKVSIKEVNDLRADEYNPGACTPLYDAIGFGINSIKNAVSDDDSVLVTIITDGEENCSREYNGRAIATLIDKLKKKGWMFTYIGANQDALQVAMTINITNALNFVQDDEGTKEMFEKERRSRERYFETNAMFYQMDSQEMAREARIAMACDSCYFDEGENKDPDKKA